jgi:glucokinase
MSDGRDPMSPADRVGQDPVRRDLLVGVDIGGSKVAVLVVDRGLRVLGRHVVASPVGAPDEAAGHVAAAIASGLASAGAGIDEVAAVGVGVPGRVDPITGVVSLAVNLGWHSLALRDRLENPARAAAAGILERRLLGPIEDFVYLSVGTGISAGVVLDGRVHRGTRGLAGEVGHIVVDASGPVCPCGLHGCLETIASGPAIARAARESASTQPSVLAGRPDATAADVFVAAAAGDRVAGEVVSRAGRSLARAIHALVMTYDVERIVLGGGVTGGGETFLEPIRVELEAIRAASELAAEMLPPGLVGVSPDGTDAGVWGGVSIAGSLASTDEGLRRVTTPDGRRRDDRIGTTG